MKKKRAGLVLTSLLIVAVIAVGMTLAFLATTTGTKTNAFSSNRNINIQLREDQWDGYTFDNKDGDSTTGDEAIEGRKKDMALGVNQAKAYLPGQIIPKNPTVRNNNEDKNGVETRVALKVSYYLKNEDGTEEQVTYNTFKNKLLAEGGIKFYTGTEADQWTNIQESTEGNMGEIYLYNTELGLEEANNTTTALFDAVPISKNLKADENGQLPRFNIKVQAYAIQAGVEGMDIENEMVKFINANSEK